MKMRVHCIGNAVFFSKHHHAITWKAIINLKFNLLKKNIGLLFSGICLSFAQFWGFTNLF